MGEISNEIATDEDIALAVAACLDRLGMTFDELEAEALAAEFRSEQARIAWVAFRDMAWGAR